MHSRALAEPPQVETAVTGTCMKCAVSCRTRLELRGMRWKVRAPTTTLVVSVALYILEPAPTKMNQTRFH